MKLKCLRPYANSGGAYDYGQIVEMPEAAGLEHLKMGRDKDHPDKDNPVWVEMMPRACPKCGHKLEDLEPEAATLTHSPRRRG